MGIEALLSTQIIDTTTVGRAVMTAADAAAARTAVDAAATSHTHAASDITSGIIATARLATGTASASTYLRGDQTWQAIAAGGISSLNGLTDATQTLAVGTSGTDFAIVSAAGVHTLNLPSASATARGVVTTDTQRFAGIKYFDSSDVRLGAGSNDFRMSRFGNDLYIDNNVGQNVYFRCNAASLLHLTVSSTSPNVRSLAGFSIATNTVLEAGGNDVLESRRSTNAQAYRVYNTYTSATSFERLNIAWVSNICTIEVTAGSGGGTLRGLRIGGATSSLVGFYGATPVDRPDTVADPTGGATIDAEARTAIGLIIDRLQELGLIA